MRYKKASLERAQWMATFQAALPVEMQGRVIWDEAIHHWYSGKSPQDAASRYIDSRNRETANS